MFQTPSLLLTLPLLGLFVLPLPGCEGGALAGMLATEREKAHSINARMVAAQNKSAARHRQPADYPTPTRKKPMTTTTDATRYPENPLRPDNKAWEQEPDFLEWRDAATGLRCRIERHPTLLHLCGYVAMPRDHRLLRTRISAARKRGCPKDA